MLSKKHFFFALIFILLGTFPILAQDEGDGGESTPKTTQGDDYPYPPFRSEEYKEFVKKGKHDQQDKFLDRAYPFPARPKDKWQLGLNVGLLMISGDVKARPGLGFGINVRKSLGYLFSVRLGFMMGSTTGRNWEPTEGWARSSLNGAIPNKALSGAPYYLDYTDASKVPDYRGLNGEAIFYNYKTKIRELTLSGILTLHNLRFHKRQTRCEIYGLAGFGGTAYRAFTNQLDGNDNEYDYSGIIEDHFINSPDRFNYDQRSEVLDALSNLWDDSYESQAERHFDDFTPFDNYSFKPTAHVGVGFAFKINRLINLALESRVTYTNDDLLDGQRWQEWGALTRDYDTYIYTRGQLNINLGAKNSVEPLWWMNPLDYAYAELGEAPCCDDLPELPDLADEDNDGVPNAWDEEPDSREGCPVDTKGRMLDSDRDGVLDCDDKEPHTRYDAIDKVDEFGIAPEMTIACTQIDDICNCVKPCAPKCTVGGRCDDGDANTIDDHYDEDCNCAGTPKPKCIIGTYCDDGDANTIEDHYDADCNCVGTPKPKCIVGTFCDDGDENTQYDRYINEECECKGEPVLETPPPPPACLPGGRCDDGNPNTINEYYDKDCNCIGGEVPPPKCAPKNTPCDDGDPKTINDVEDGDCNCKGICPPAGTACDDGNEKTINDAADGNCGCEGVCPPAGTACDDGDPKTINDATDGECGCKGICPPEGTACDDKDPNTTNDVADGNCGCKGVVPCAPKGTPCDDGNSRTIGDAQDGNCNCIGTVPPPPPPPPPASTCCDQVLPRILFSLNKYSVRPEFKVQLAEVAAFLNDPSCSGDRLAVIGHTDVRADNAYNDVLSYKRAREVVDILVNEFGIPRNRLVIEYRGEMDPTIGGLSSSPSQKNIDADHALNRRVEFRCAAPGAVDMPMPPGPADAGSRKPKPQPKP